MRNSMKKVIIGIVLVGIIGVILGTLCIFTCNTCGKLRFDKFNSYVMRGVEGNMCQDCRNELSSFSGFLR